MVRVPADRCITTQQYIFQNIIIWLWVIFVRFSISFCYIIKWVFMTSNILYFRNKISTNGKYYIMKLNFRRRTRNGFRSFPTNFSRMIFILFVKYVDRDVIHHTSWSMTQSSSGLYIGQEKFVLSPSPNKACFLKKLSVLSRSAWKIGR